MKPSYYSLLSLFLALAACTNTPNDPSDADTTTEPAPQVIELVERTDYEVDSTIRLVYQLDKNSDVRYGNYKEYDVATNRLLVERTYKEGKVEGAEKYYYPSGEVESILHYKGGVHDGPFKYFYENGQLKQEGQYEAGKMEGWLKTYYSDGQLKEEVTHLDGVTEGPFKEYNPNGTLKVEGAYTAKGEAESLEQGMIKMYDEEGELERRMVCKQGQCCTVWIKDKGDVTPPSTLCKAIVDEYQKENPNQ